MSTNIDLPEAASDERWHHVEAYGPDNVDTWTGFVLAADEEAAEQVVEAAHREGVSLGLSELRFTTVVASPPDDDVTDRIRDTASPNAALFRDSQGELRLVEG